MRYGGSKTAVSLLLALTAGGLVSVATPTAQAALPLADQRVGWTVTADSEELVGENGAAANVLDGNLSTIWHTQWKPTPTDLPHTLTVDMHVVQAVAGLTYVPRPATTGRNGVVGQYRVETSPDAAAWTLAVSGTLPDTSQTKTVTFPAVTVRYVRLVALSEAGNRGPWSSAAELDLVLPTATPSATPTATASPTATPAPSATASATPSPTASVSALPPRSEWTVKADSEELVGENGAAVNVLDGNPATFWHTQWNNGAPALPHTLTLDTKALRSVTSLMYLPRPASSANGRIGDFRVETSTDSSTWGVAATGTFADVATATTVPFAAVTARYIRLVALTEAGNRGPWSSAAELDLASTDPGTPTATPSATATPTPTLTATPSPGPLPPRSVWTATADSEELVGDNGAAANVLDGNPATYWHTQWQNGAPALPHTLTLDTKALRSVTSLSYLPRPAGSANGRIGQYRVETSTDAVAWTVAAGGTFADIGAATTVRFPAVLARYVRLVAVSEAGNRGPWSSAAEVDVASTDPNAPQPTATPTPSPTRTGPRAAWTVTADSEELIGEDGAAANVLDGDPMTLWHTPWYGGTAPFPHTLTVDTKTARRVAALVYQPRRSSSGPNGRIGQYTVEVSLDGVAWQQVAAGTLPDTSVSKTLAFPAVDARFVRLTALSEAGDRGSITSASEIDLLTPADPVPGSGSWGPVIAVPEVPVAAAVLPTGEVLTWAAFEADRGGTYDQGKTQSAIFNPRTGAVAGRTISETGHDMFCPGIVFLPDGTLLVQGGGDSANSSLYEAGTHVWSAGVPLAIPRGYQGAVTLGDGSVFTVGGSWSGGLGGKDGELWTRSGTRVLPGAQVTPILTHDRGGIFRQDNHAWLFAWKGNRAFHAGPSTALGFYDVSGDGAWIPAGVRGDDADAMNGSAAMYDVGKILTVGGAPDYSDSVATANANIIDINGPRPVVTKLGAMHSARAFSYASVLPDGTVLITGGQAYSKGYTDETAAMKPELFDPATGTFTELAPMTVPRTYHSFGLLLPDATVLVGGGGLCGGCGHDHADLQVFTPPYLDGKQATRPVITQAPTSASAGTTLSVRTDRPVRAFSLVRMGSATHSLNTDQRRIPLTPTVQADGGVSLTLPADRGVLVPGPWMLFAMDDQGVPSVAATMIVR